MNTIELKTNIMCGSCIAKVTPTLNEVIGEGNWKVDTLNPKKILTVSAENLDQTEVISAVQKAGYKAEALALKRSVIKPGTVMLSGLNLKM